MKKLARKTKKLINNPNQFFKDAQNPLTEAVADILDAKYPLTEAIVKIISKSKTEQPKKSTRQEVKKLTGHMYFRETVNLLPSKGKGINSFWDKYVNYNKKNNFNSQPTIFIYPSSCYAWDETIANQAQLLNKNAKFIDLWEYFPSNLDVDDIEYLLRKESKLLIEFRSKFLSMILDAGCESIIVPYDSTPLTRTIILSAKEIGIKTICALCPTKAIEGSYINSSLVSTPVSDIVIFNSRHFSPELASVLEKREESIEYVDSHSGDLTSSTSLSNDTCKARFGVAFEDDVYTLIAPRQQLLQSDKVLCDSIELVLLEVQQNYNAQSHFILFLDNKKSGFLTNKTKKILSEMPRKTILYVGDSSAQQQAFEISKTVYVFDHYDAMLASKSDADIKHYSSETIEDYVYDKRDGLNFASSIEQSIISERGQGSNNRLDASLKLIESIKAKSSPAFDVIAVADPTNNISVTNGRQKYLPELLNFNTRIFGAGNVNDNALAETHIQWGAEPNEPKSRPEYLRTAFGRNKLYLEDGFVRSIGLWVDVDEPTLSLIIDTDAIYYDSTKSSLLEKLLNSNKKFSAKNKASARLLINRIVQTKISKYNYAPIMDLELDKIKKKKILLIDQKAGDMSIKYGSASSESFDAMLNFAVSQGDDVEIYIKQHPCAISGGEDEAHYTHKKLGEIAQRSNVHLIAFDINPYSLIESMDEVYVVSSGMGLEALMAGKTVRCFGVPFYAGWGITIDEITPSRRARSRSLEEIFHAFYVMLSVYFNPQTGETCDLGALLTYIEQNRNINGSAK
jgi:capsular polysaccharide export protein